MKNVSPLPQKYGAAKLFSALIMMFFEHQINILEWFLKDHMTLKFEVRQPYNHMNKWQLENIYFIL